jgi:hypothetical protein
MIKPIIFTSVFLLTNISGEVLAACSGTRVTNVTDLNTLLLGNTVCAANGGDAWQEFHQSGGVLIDYKKGPTDTVDPSETVGSWSVTGNDPEATVTYNYGSGGIYSYAIYNTGSSYDFCGATTVTDVTIKPGQVAC